ncbi:MAG: hypothetical protein FH756_01845 [Firmicutes bacterium]|nr:hypothetical protein [Bacillota bacterium]
MYNKPMIEVFPEKCRGCRRCEVACSWDASLGTVNPRMAGIRIMKLEEEGKDYPVLNQQCLDQFCGKVSPGRGAEEEPLCVSTCLFGALKIAEEVSKVD